MAKNDKWLRSKYFEALTALGEKLTGKERLNTLKKKWKALREDYKTTGQKPPNLYATAKSYEHDEIPDVALSEWFDQYRDEYMNTEPASIDLDAQKAQEDIDLFEWTLEQIYRDTLSFIDENKEGLGHEKGKLASIASNRKSEIDAVYWAIKEELQKLTNSDIPLQVVAQAISENVELDYSIAVALSPPSDIIIHFEMTLEQLKGVMAQINARAQELAQEEENRYLGK